MPALDIQETSSKKFIIVLPDSLMFCVAQWLCLTEIQLLAIQSMTAHCLGLSQL